MVTHFAMKGAPRPEPKPQRPDHEVFGDLVAKYSGQAGRFPGDAGQLVRDASVLAAEVSGRCRDAFTRGVGFARDQKIPAEGRHELINGLSAEVGESAAEKLKRAETMIEVARATLTVNALAKVSEKDRAVARQDAMMLLSGVRPEELPERMAELARREDHIGAIVASSWGQDYLSSRGADPAGHAIVQGTAIEAAAESSDPQRAASAEALSRLHHMEAAVLAAHQQARHLDGDLKRVRSAVRNPLAAENARLEQVITSQAHQLADAKRAAGDAA